MKTPHIKRTVWILVLSLFCMLVVSTPKAFAVNMAVVDIQRVLENSKAGRRAKSILEKEVKARQELIASRQKDLKAKKDIFDKKSVVWNPEKKLTERTKLEKELVEFQRFVQQSDVDLQRRQLELMQPVLEDIRALVRDIGSKEKYDLVLEKNSSGVLFTRAAEDLTDRVTLNLEKKTAKR